MKKDAFVRARVELNLKQEAENILDMLGLTPTQAVTILYKYIAREKEYPISLKLNAKTQKVLQDSDEGKNLIKVKNADDMFTTLGI